MAHHSAPFQNQPCRFLPALLLCSLALAARAGDSSAPVPVPTPQQVAWHEAGVGLFFHWAPNVYQGTEGDNRSTPRDRINPDRFDADQWVQAVKAAEASAFGLQSLANFGLWIFVYGLMVWLPAHWAPPGRSARVPRWWAYPLATIAPFFFMPSLFLLVPWLWLTAKHPPIHFPPIR